MVWWWQDILSWDGWQATPPVGGRRRRPGRPVAGGRVLVPPLYCSAGYIERSPNRYAACLPPVSAGTKDTVRADDASMVTTLTRDPPSLRSMRVVRFNRTSSPSAPYPAVVWWSCDFRGSLLTSECLAYKARVKRHKLKLKQYFYWSRVKKQALNI